MSLLWEAVFMDPTPERSLCEKPLPDYHFLSHTSAHGWWSWFTISASSGVVPGDPVFFIIDEHSLCLLSTHKEASSAPHFHSPSPHTRISSAIRDQEVTKVLPGLDFSIKFQDLGIVKYIANWDRVVFKSDIIWDRLTWVKATERSLEREPFWYMWIKLHVLPNLLPLSFSSVPAQN